MMLPMRLSPPPEHDLALLVRLVLHEPVPRGLDHRDPQALGRPVQEVPVVRHLLLHPRPTPRRVAEPVEPEGTPVGPLDGGQRLDPAPPHPRLLLRCCLDHPALEGVGDVVRRHLPLDVVHGEERHAQELRVVLVDAEARERNRRPAVGQGAHDPVLGGELGIEEEEVLGRRHPHHQAPLVATGRAGATEDRLIGEAVGGRGLDVEDLGHRPVVRPGGEPTRQDRGDLLRIALADVRHGAALYPRCTRPVPGRRFSPSRRGARCGRAHRRPPPPSPSRRHTRTCRKSPRPIARSPRAPPAPATPPGR